jgi:adapter protein MecA 1/2
MKIEKVNENQIRCTLTREDLASRELKISELAYGTEKAKNLFRDMMQQANYEFGFEAEDIPLMIEAIPLNAECIVLIITKVEDPEELDTRFSRFAPSIHAGDDDYEDIEDSISENADEVMDLFRRLQESRKSAIEDDIHKIAAHQGDAINGKTLARVYVFDSLHPIITVARLFGSKYQGDSFLYKDGHNGKYLLALNQGRVKPEEFNKACNILSEYGNAQKALPSGGSYLEEHYTLLIRNHALRSLADL